MFVNSVYPNNYLGNQISRRAYVSKRMMVKKKKSKHRFLLIRICLGLLAIGLCTWQVGNCLIRFFREPIGVTVDIDEDFHSYKYPTIAICPYDDGIFRRFYKAAETLCKKNSCLDFKTYRINLTKLWSQTRLEGCIATQSCDDVLDSECESSEQIKGKPIDVLQGRCYLFSNRNVYRFMSSETTQFSITFPELKEPVDLVAQFISMHKSVYTYNQQNNLLKEGPINWVYFMTTEFHNANARRNPCWSEEKVTECMNSCLDQLLSKSQIKCRLPFIPTNHPLCSSYEEIKHFERVFRKIYKIRDQCQCKRPCSTVIYINKIVAVTSLTNETVAKLVFSSAIPKTIVSEFYSYPFSSFMAETLSNVGFFLGLSLISILRIIPRMLSKGWNFIRQSKRVRINC